MIWMKITAIADPDESDWRFISDQICLADSSRLQQPGFELIFSTVHVSAVYIALQSSYWVNQINWTCAACLK